jgi:hypothetical protein
VGKNVLEMRLKHYLPWDFLSVSAEHRLEKYIRMTLVRTGIDPNNRVKIMHKLIESDDMRNSAVAARIIGHLLSHALSLPGNIRQNALHHVGMGDSPALCSSSKEGWAPD